MPASRTLTINA
jgi:hypothetical protein